LELNGKSLLLKGENGAGKSSIVEAIEYFFTGKLSVFEGEGTQSLSLQKHAPHKDFSTDDMNIEITFAPGQMTLERTFEEEPEPPKQLEDYFQTAKKGTFILRRSQILKFITSVPADRFRAIASILGIEPLDNIELAMKRACDDLEGGVGFKRERIGILLMEISKLLGEDISQSKEVLLSVNKKLKEANLSTIASFDEIDKPADEMLKAFRKTTDMDQVTKLNEIIEELESLHINSEIAENLRNLNRKITPLLEERTKRELSIREFLVKSRQALEEAERNICPLCGQEVDREKLLKQIDARLHTLSQLSEEASEIRRTSIPIEEKLDLLLSKIKKISSDLESFRALSNVRKRLLPMLEFIEEFLERIKSAKELKEEIPVKAFEQNKVRLEKLLKTISTKCQKAFEKIGVPEDWKNKMKTISLVNQVKAMINELDNIEKQLKIEERRYNLASKMYTTFSEIKKSKMEEIYKSIAGNVNAFYSALHPNDPHGNIELNVAPSRRASTELKIESFGIAKEDPRAFTSEGHQDSLGLCIFLAFVKKFNEGCNLIVLDDVVSTIDAQHRELICELLFKEFKDYQLIITTHDGIWYEQLRSHQRACGIDGKFKNLEIIRWEPETGPIIEPFKPRWERIQKRIDSSDKPGAGNEGRQYLEWLLKKICQVTRAPVPFEIDGKYVVFDLWDSAKQRVSKLVKDHEFRDKVLQRFQGLEATIIMGNLLSHDNPLAHTVSIEEIKRFCEAVHELNNVFSCPNCGSFFKYYEDIKKLRCSSSRCKSPIEISCL